MGDKKQRNTLWVILGHLLHHIGVGQWHQALAWAKSLVDFLSPASDVSLPKHKDNEQETKSESTTPTSPADE